MPSHRVVEEWMGEHVETLEDLLRPGLHAVCIGINPSPVSVAAGHYYQGRLGQRFFARLRHAGPLPRVSGWEDDLAFEAGIGFTDVVKRPTARASDVRADEFTFGRSLLLTKLEETSPALVLFSFKKAATALLGPLTGSGLTGDLIGEAEVFLMPGPYERAERVAAALGELAGRAGGES